MKFRLISLILIAVLIVGCFCGCGNTSSEPEVQPSAPVDEPTETPAADEETAPTVYTTFDYKAAYESYSPDAVVLTVNGTEITWKEYFGWLYSMMEQYEMYLGTEFAWSDLFSETQTFDEYTKFYAETMCSQYAVVNSAANDAGLELSEDEQKYIDDLLVSDAASYTGGDVDAFIEYLESTYMDEDYYRYINTVSILYQKLFEHSFGVAGENMTNEDVVDFIETNGYLYAKHILFLTTDGAGGSLDDAAKAEKLALAEDTLAQLRAIEDQEELLAKFDELMNTYSEDTGLVTNPNGYYFLPGEMVIEFEEGTKALENYAVSDIIETAYGYHIILRLPITPDAEYSSGVTFRTLAASYAFDTMMGEEFQKAEIVYTDEFADFSLENIMTKIEVEY